MTTYTRKDNAFKIKETPDSAVADFEVGTDGKVTLGSLKFPVTAVTATGSVIGDAAALSSGINVVTGADATKGVILPVTTGGDVVIIKNNTAAALKVYPQSGGTINALSTSAALSTAAGLVSFIMYSTSATQWYTLPLLPS